MKVCVMSGGEGKYLRTEVRGEAKSSGAKQRTESDIYLDKFSASEIFTIKLNYST